jgi:hypothetical protein
LANSVAACRSAELVMSPLDWPRPARFALDLVRSPEIRDNGTFVLIDRVKPSEQTVNNDEAEYTGDQPQKNLHGWPVIKELLRSSKPE